MKLGELGPAELQHRLRVTGLFVQIGPFSINLRSPLGPFADVLRVLYSEYPITHGSPFADFHVEVPVRKGLRRWLRPQTCFKIDGQPLFHPVPVDQAIAAFEWGLNWSIANYSHEHLMIHAAVVERDGAGMLLPGEPGAGKSTLCAALVSHGWRLLSDEMALISLTDHSLVPVPRPIALKNESINVIRQFAPEVVFGPLARDTVKGDVAHVRPPPESVRRAGESASPRRVVFPKYVAGAQTTLTPETKGKAFMRLARHSFNYHVLGRLGFDTLGDLMDDVTPFDLVYSDLTDAVRRLNTLGC